MAAPAHTAVYQPWDKVTELAIARLKGEMSDALAKYEQAMVGAGRVLDLAYATAEAPAASLRSAAYTAFDKYMSLADDLEKSVIGPAVVAYNRLVTEASTVFNDAVDNATHAYNAELATVQATKTRAADLPKAG